MKCEQVLIVLDPFRTGEVEEGEWDAVRDHLRGCARCAGEMTRLNSLADELSRLEVPLPEATAKWIAAAASDRYASLETPLGFLWVGYTSRGLSLIRPGGGVGTDFEAHYRERLGRRPRPGPLPAAYAEAVGRATQGRDAVVVPLDLSGLSPFERRVLPTLRRIPRGAVRTYGWLAAEIDRPQAARAVGTALARNPLPFFFPCHRVVPAGGGVGRYLFGAEIKRRLLESEGAVV